MIRMQNISKSYRTISGSRRVLDDVSAHFPRGRKIGILGANGAGKSTLLRLLGGSEHADSGRIWRDGTVSWPIGFSGGTHPQLTGRENTRFVARIYDFPLTEVEEFVQNYAELGEYFDMKVKTYSSGMRARLAFAMSLVFDFDCYLVDEATSVGDARFRDKFKAALLRRLSAATVIMVSHNPDTILLSCDLGAIILDGKLEFFDDIQTAVREYSLLMRPVK